MKYRQTKVYHDGSHYVGIQRTPRERRYRPREKEEVFFFDGEPTEEEREKTETTPSETEPKEVEKPETSQGKGALRSRANSVGCTTKADKCGGGSESSIF